MDSSIENMVKELIAKAKKDAIDIKVYSPPSSLHCTIKTPEQAAYFMFLLKAAESGKISGY